MNTTTQRTCQKCGAALHDDALEGLCGRCLARFAFESDPNAPEKESGTAASLQGHTFGEYILLEEIARGGMGVVYKARQKRLNRVVALKLILHGPFSNEEFVRRFQTEAEAAAQLHHPNIVTIHEIGEHDGHQFLSMEYIEGKSLAEVVLEKTVPARRAAAYLQTIARAIQYAHERGVVHRDLKPSNLLLDVLDEPHVTDFGLAKLLNTDLSLTTTGQALGSPAYMAPEQAAGKNTANPVPGDVYSLGAVLYHLVTGRPPFQGATMQDILLQSQAIEPVAPRRLNSAVPMDLETICLKCLQKEPAKRYESARELADDLGRFLADKPILARPVSNVEKIWRACRRRPIPATLAVALALALVGGIAGIVMEWRRAEQHARGEERERLLSEQYATKMRLDLYAADINLAAQAVEHSDFGLARRTLASLQPKEGEEDLRGFEWRYLMNICRGGQLATLAGHSWIVTCTAFSPDGHRLASGSQDGSVKLWDADHAQLITNFPSRGGADWSVGFSPDGKLLMTAGNVRQVEFWDMETFQRVASFPGQIAALSKTGSLLAASDSSPFYWEKSGKITLWDYRSGEKLGKINEAGRAMAISPDAKWLAAAGPQRDVRMYETASGRLARTFPTSHSIWSLAFSPDGNSLAAAGWAGEALIWDLGGDGPPKKLSGHGRNLWSVLFSPDGSRIATTSSDQTIWLWDATSLQPGMVLQGHDNEVWCAAFRGDGKMLASGGKDQMVMLWSTDGVKSAVLMPNYRHFPPLISRDSRWMVTLAPSGSGYQPQLWDVANRKFVENIPNSESIGFSPASNQIVTLNIHDAALEFHSPQNTTPATQIKLESVNPGDGSFEASGFSPGWETFFAVDQGGVIRVWETRTGRLLKTLSGPKPPVRSAVLSAQGKRFALSVEHENFARLYDVPSGSETHLAGHRDFVSGLAFSPDAATLASGSVDGTLKLWDCASGKETATLPGHPEETSGVAFSPDGKTLASIGHQDSVKLWHLATRRLLLSIDFRSAGIFVQFSPDGGYLVAAAEDDTVRFFDAPGL